MTKRSLADLYMPSIESSPGKLTQLSNFLNMGASGGAAPLLKYLQGEINTPQEALLASGGAIIEGFKGKSFTSYQDVLTELGAPKPLAVIGGIAGDIILDPSTYLLGPLFAKIGTKILKPLAQMGVRGLKSFETGEKFVGGVEKWGNSIKGLLEKFHGPEKFKRMQQVAQNNKHVAWGNSETVLANMAEATSKVKSPNAIEDIVNALEEEKRALTTVEFVTLKSGGKIQVAALDKLPEPLRGVAYGFHDMRVKEGLQRVEIGVLPEKEFKEGVLSYYPHDFLGKEEEVARIYKEKLGREIKVWDKHMIPRKINLSLREMQETMINNPKTGKLESLASILKPNMNPFEAFQKYNYKTIETIENQRFITKSLGEYAVMGPNAFPEIPKTFREIKNEKRSVERLRTKTAKVLMKGGIDVRHAYGIVKEATTKINSLASTLKGAPAGAIKELVQLKRADDIEQLVSAGFREFSIPEIKTITGLNSVWMPQEVIKEMSHYAIFAQDTKLNAFLGNLKTFLWPLDKAEKWFRTAVTTPWPAYNFRNIVGGHNLGFLDQGWKWFNLKLHKAATLALKKDFSADSEIMQHLKDFKANAGAISFSDKANIIDHLETISAQKAGIVHSLGKYPKKYLDATRKFAAFCDNETRFVDYILHRRAGKSVEDAMAAMNKGMIDYHGLSPVEKEFLGRAIPFYTFWSRNIPIQLRALALHPDRQMAITKIIQNFQSRDADRGDNIPDYHKQLGLIRLSGRRFIPRTGLPLEDVIESTSARGLISRLSPVFGKTALELLTNQEFYTGKPIVLPSGMGQVSRKFANLPEGIKKVLGIVEGPRGGTYTLHPRIAHTINALGAGRAMGAVGTIVSEGRSFSSKMLELLTGLSVKETKHYEKEPKKKK